jgi:hypothetical protein
MGGAERGFSWSATAWRSFAACPRAYFLRYPGARGGGDRYAPEDVRNRYRIKQLQSIPAWSDRVFREGVRAWLETAWRRPAQARLEALRDNVVRRLKAGWREARGGGPGGAGDEPGRVAFREWIQSAPPPPADPGASFCELRDDVMERLERFFQSAVCAEIAGLPYLCVRDIRVPASFDVAGVCVWTAPLLVWHRDGLVQVLHLHPRDRTAHATWDWQAGVGELFARHIATRLGLPPERATVVRSTFAGEPGEGGLTVYGGRHVQEVAAVIQSSAAAMDQGAEESAYPCRPTPAGCAACEFRSLCPRPADLDPSVEDENESF